MNNLQTIALKAKLRASKEIEVALRGCCMEPLLTKGDTVKITSISKITIGEICLLSLTPEKFVLHRIVSLDDSMIVSKGDYSGKCDHLPKEAIVGKAIELRPYGSNLWISLQEGLFSKSVSVLLSKMLMKRHRTKMGRLLNRFIRKLIWRRNSCRRRRLRSSSYV